MYPSKNQKQAELAASKREQVQIFRLEHDIPICESVSIISAYRWHSMSEDEFAAYRARLTAFCITYIDNVEAKEGQHITHAIAHHAFLNPIILCDVNTARRAVGKPEIPFSVFVHGTALKMFHKELAGDNTTEYPMRFTPLVRTAVDGSSACSRAVNIFYISEAERPKLLDVYESLSTPLVLLPNGINQDIFKPTGATREEVLASLTTKPYEGSGREPSPLPTSGFSHWSCSSASLLTGSGSTACYVRCNSMRSACRRRAAESSPSSSVPARLSRRSCTWTLPSSCSCRTCTLSGPSRSRC